MHLLAIMQCETYLFIYTAFEFVVQFPLSAWTLSVQMKLEEEEEYFAAAQQWTGLGLLASHNSGKRTAGISR